MSARLKDFKIFEIEVEILLALFWKFGIYACIFGLVMMILFSFILDFDQLSFSPFNSHEMLIGVDCKDLEDFTTNFPSFFTV